MNWLHKIWDWLQNCTTGRRPHQISARPSQFVPILEPLECREVPSVASPAISAANPVGTSTFVSPFTPSEIRSAYGISSISFSGGVSGDGTGQTIALVDAFDDPNIARDLAAFDAKFGVAAPPSFTVVNEFGQTSNLPVADSSGAWALETSLDVEWAHAVAPGASIVLVEASSANSNDMVSAISTAAKMPGVSVVSISWTIQGGFAGETGDDSYFNVPGVTFVASSGDNGSPGGYPAESPYVVSVGGTSLSFNGSQYGGETAWSSSGGGISAYESRPSYQNGVASVVGSMRGTPDVAFDADPHTGVYVYDSYNSSSLSGPWIQAGGTSLGAPAWAGLIAIADQGRAVAGHSPLSSIETLDTLYSLSSSDFHDVTSGSNGAYSATAGYDLVTGLGSPVANLLVSDLAASNQTVAYTAYYDGYIGYINAYEAYVYNGGSYNAFLYSYVSFYYAYYAWYFESIGVSTAADACANVAYDYSYWAAQYALIDWQSNGNGFSENAYNNESSTFEFSYYKSIGH